MATLLSAGMQGWSGQPFQYGFDRGWAKGIKVPLDFSISLDYLIDLESAVAQTMLTGVEGAWIDNSVNPQPMTITVQTIGQVITVLANAIATAPIFAPKYPRFEVISTGTAKASIIFLNKPMRWAHYVV